MKTRAVVFTAPGEVSFDTIEMPPPLPGQVQIETHFSTISAGTEGWALQDRFTWQKTPFPCVPGYQRVGVVRELGEGVTDFRVGERVFATVGVWDGPVKPQWGSHAAVANTWAGEVYKLSPEIDALDAAGTVVAQVGYNAAYRAVLKPGQWVIVYGDGIIGQSAAQAARSRGAKVILVGHRSERLDLGRRFSADVAIDNKKEDVAAVVKSHTGGMNVTAVLDSVQHESAQREYVPLLDHGAGQIVYCGFTPGNTWADMALLQQRELTTHYISGWSRARMEATLKLFATKAMSLKPLTTHLAPCATGPELYRKILTKSDFFLGLTLDWTGEHR